MTSHRLLPIFVAPFLVILSGGNAAAQTVSASAQAYPNRVVNGVNLGASTRPQNLGPYGISDADCLQDMTLQFSVAVAGFTGSDSIEVWGSLGSDCTAPADRGIGATAGTCWGLRAGNVVDPIVQSPQTYTFNVRVQDLVGWQQAMPQVPALADPPAKGKEACSAQPTPAAVQMNINFIAVDSSGKVDGTPYQYQITTDLVGPPAPGGQKVAMVGADLLATWSPNSDKDTYGYDVFFASSPSTPDGGTACSAPALTTPLGVSPADAGGTGITAFDPIASSYDLGPAQNDTEAALVVTAVDGLGNVGPAGAPACDAVSTADGADGDTAPPGVSCAVAAPGEPGAAMPCLGLLAVAWGMTRLSRRRTAKN